MTETPPRFVVGIMAHNEERRIARCLASLPLDDSDFAFHVVVNGTTDRTADIARAVGGTRVIVHDWPAGGKARSWNRFVFDSNIGPAHAWIFVDGDAEVQPGSLMALCKQLADNEQVNAAAGMPCNGRKHQAYRREMIRTHGLFGDLYALSGDFVERMRTAGIRLPDDLIGDDGLLAAMAKTNLANETDWRDNRVAPCEGAGFLCEPVRLTSPTSWTLQYRRMINYSQRHFQNRIISSIMRSTGPVGLPRNLAESYAHWLPEFAPRKDIRLQWFDRVALRRMRAACVQSRDLAQGEAGR